MQSGEDKSYDDINVTPMVDLYLVLLLIFIIMTTAGVQGVKVKLPQSDRPKPDDLSQSKMQAITVNREGNIALNTLPVTLDQLEAKLSQLKTQTPNLPVVIRGDSAMAYQPVMNVLNVLGRLDITDIGLATQPKR